MKSLSKAVLFFGTAALALILGAWTCLAVKTWTYMFLPLKASWALGAVAAFLPAVLLNKLLTRSYSRIESDSSELNSVFGMLLGVNLLVLPALWFGVGGTPSSLAVDESARVLAEAMGVIEPVDEATLATFPCSDVGTGYVWVANIGTSERARVIARMPDGRLQAQVLPPRGETFTGARGEHMVGPTDGRRVMLVQVPDDPNQSRRLEADWSGGHVIFEMGPGHRSARFVDAR